MKRFIIQAIKEKDNLLPAEDFCYTAIEAIKYVNWLKAETVCDYVLLADIEQVNNFIAEDCIPIGSVEFVLAWLKCKGITEVKPLNIPKELWHMCKRIIKIDYCSNSNGRWMMKDVYEIKHPANGHVWFNGDGGNDKKWFLSRWIEDVISEWRIFVYDNNIIDAKNYGGDPFIVPDKTYIQHIIDAYDKKAYTLDVMVYNSNTSTHSESVQITDIVELHDFFSCGLYGFDNHIILLKMHEATIKELINGGA